MWKLHTNEAKVGGAVPVARHGRAAMAHTRKVHRCRPDWLDASGVDRALRGGY